MVAHLHPAQAENVRIMTDVDGGREPRRDRVPAVVQDALFERDPHDVDRPASSDHLVIGGAKVLSPTNRAEDGVWQSGVRGARVEHDFSKDHSRTSTAGLGQSEGNADLD